MEMAGEQVYPNFPYPFMRLSAILESMEVAAKTHFSYNHPTNDALKRIPYDNNKR